MKFNSCLVVRGVWRRVFGGTVAAAATDVCEPVPGQCLVRLHGASVGHRQGRVSAHPQQTHRARLLGRLQSRRKVPRQVSEQWGQSSVEGRVHGRPCVLFPNPPTPHMIRLVSNPPPPPPQTKPTFMFQKRKKFLGE